MYCRDLNCWQASPCILHQALRERKSQAKQKSRKKKITVDKKQTDQNYVSVPICKENPKFEAFYKPLLRDEKEWESFAAILRSPLPVSFRLNSSPGFHQFLVHVLTDTFHAKPASSTPSSTAAVSSTSASNIPTTASISSVAITTQTSVNEEELVPVSIPWSPLAWQVASSRKGLKTELSVFRTWLVRHYESGNVNRQEVVSMVPPLLLDVKPFHYILDMCAAPGSKTAQLVEALHADKKGGIPSGFVWANDADSKRASLLGHQLSRLNSTSILVTSHAAQNLPILKWPDSMRCTMLG